MPSSHEHPAWDPFPPEPPQRSRWVTYAAIAIVGLIAVACYVGQRVIANRTAEAMRDPGATVAAAIIPTPEDVVELGGRDGAGTAAVEAEVNRDHRIESATAAVEISNDADGGLVQWLTIEATADACGVPASDACSQLVDDIAWIALLSYEPLDQLEGIQISVGEQSTYRYTIAEWQDRLEFATVGP